MFFPSNRAVQQLVQHYFPRPSHLQRPFALVMKEPSQGGPTEVTISSVLSGLGDGPIDIGELISHRELNFQLQCGEWQKGHRLPL